MTPAQARDLFRAHCDPRDTLAHYGETAAVGAILAAVEGVQTIPTLPVIATRIRPLNLTAWSEPA